MWSRPPPGGAVPGSDAGVLRCSIPSSASGYDDSPCTVEVFSCGENQALAAAPTQERGQVGVPRISRTGWSGDSPDRLMSPLGLQGPLTWPEQHHRTLLLGASNGSCAHLGSEWRHQLDLGGPSGAWHP